MAVAGFGAVAEQKRNAPDCRKTYKCVDDSAYNTGLSAANPCDEIELKDADRAPVDAADNRQDKTNFVEHISSSFSFWVYHSQRKKIYADKTVRPNTIAAMPITIAMIPRILTIFMVFCILNFCSMPGVPKGKKKYKRPRKIRETPAI